MIHRGSTGILMLHDPIHGLISQSPHDEDIQIGIVFQPFPQAVDVYIHGVEVIERNNKKCRIYAA